MKHTVVISLVRDPLGLGWPDPAIENRPLDGRYAYGLWDPQLLELAATRVAAVNLLQAAGCVCITRDKVERNSGTPAPDDGTGWMARAVPPFVPRGIT